MIVLNADKNIFCPLYQSDIDKKKKKKSNDSLITLNLPQTSMIYLCYIKIINSKPANILESIIAEIILFSVE